MNDMMRFAALLVCGIVTGLASPEIGNRLKMMAAEPRGFSPEELAAFIVSEHQRIDAILRQAGVIAQ